MTIDMYIVWQLVVAENSDYIRTLKPNTAAHRDRSQSPPQWSTERHLGGAAHSEGVGRGARVERGVAERVRQRSTK